MCLALAKAHTQGQAPHKMVGIRWWANLKWWGAALEASVVLERPAPPPTPGAQEDTRLGTPQGLQDISPLTTPTPRTPEQTLPAPTWRTLGLLRSLFDFAHHSVGDLWQLRTRVGMHQVGM
jgi:hypothetical protein